jgi:sugar phosphate isomerase/epimerase
MYIGANDSFQLTYCTNIHPANGWRAVLASLEQYAPALKARFAPARPFGIGLRLSGQESAEILQGDLLDEFRAFLEERGLYVFTLNGFPHGPFHRQAVKDAVHAPDWRSEERVEYTLRLVQVLARLLPERTDGGISTSPLSYKPWIGTGDTITWQHLTRQVVRVALALARAREEYGRLIHLDIEPEPDGLLENSAELARFYTDWLLPIGGRMLAEQLQIAVEDAQERLLEHIRVCWDTCHVALAYEDPAEVLRRYTEIGIKVGKIQVSSALKVLLPGASAERAPLASALQPFAESTYLHQVIQQNADGTLHQYPDLPDALPSIGDARAKQWRIHFHVPIFVERYGLFGSTQGDIENLFALLRKQPFCRQLEIETYTWEVLPPDLKQDLLESIAREYEWVLHGFD